MAPIRLLNAKSMEFKMFGGSSSRKVPPYAILSHVWCKDDDHEIIYQDMMAVRTHKRRDVRGFEALDLTDDAGDVRASHSKIMGHLANAVRCKIEWVWIDSCCINKHNHSELSSAINSMFTWYQNAARCFVYLADVTKSVLPSRSQQIEWFTRGWTLQELLAAGWETTAFFNRDWRLLGSKRDLMTEICQRSRIAPEHLEDYTLACAAVKLSWAADRQTSFEEDRVYSLLGLFDNMEMDTRYGSGREQRVWREFQEKIIATTRDESIFAWQLGNDQPCGILAPSIDCFRESGNLTINNGKKYRARRADCYRVAHGTLLFDLPTVSKANPLRSTVIQTFQVKTMKSYDLTLNCWRTGTFGKVNAACIKLSKMQGVWRRSNCTELKWKKRVKSSDTLLYHEDRTMEFQIALH